PPTWQHSIKYKIVSVPLGPMPPDCYDVGDGMGGSAGEIAVGSTPSISSRESFLYVSTRSGSSRSTQSALSCSPRDLSTEMISVLWMYMSIFPRLRRLEYGTAASNSAVG